MEQREKKRKQISLCCSLASTPLFQQPTQWLKMVKTGAPSTLPCPVLNQESSLQVMK